MYGHRSFLVLGGGATDIVSLVKEGLEILNYNFSFNQAVDDKRKATTGTRTVAIDIILSQLPTQSIIEWGMKSCKYENGLIVMLDAHNIPIGKIIFENAACVGFDVNYTSGETYATTKLLIQAEKLIVGDDIDFDSECTDYPPKQQKKYEI